MFRYIKYLAVLAIICCLTAVKSFSQAYILNSTLNGQTVVTCSGTFYDSNPIGNYGTNENYTVTFCPGTANSVIRLDFFLVEMALSDSLIIYNGPNTSSPVLVVYDFFNNVVNKVVSTHPSGCLTIRFKSDDANIARGWQASLRCVPPCQPFSGTLTSVPAADANGVVNVCLGDSVTLTANMNYPNSGTSYTQSNNLSMFRWRTGFMNDTSGINLTSISKKITQHAGYRVDVAVSDSNGCAIAQTLQVKVRTSAKPKFNIAQPPAICPGDTANLLSQYQLTSGAYVVPPFSGNSLFLPDGSGVTYSDTIRIRDFAAGQTLTNINDFMGVFMTMEHSFLGDLEIKLIAPNGSSVVLKQYPGGGGTYLGEPVDNDTKPNIPGIGYLYGFTPTPNFGTMVAEANLHRYTYTDVTGVVNANRLYLPAGNYTSFGGLNSLIGAPLNGNWIIQIKDNLASDNGYILNWFLSFAENLYPNRENYTIGVKNYAWLPAAGLIADNGLAASVSPSVSGTAGYTFRIVDSANCRYDTVVNVVVRPTPAKPVLGPDKTLCVPATLQLTVQNADPANQYTWNTGATSTSLPVQQAGTYMVTATNSFGCKSKDTIVVIADPGATVNLGRDTFFCASQPNILQAAITGNVTAYKWSDGSTNATLPVTGTGTYWLEITSDKGCKTADSINLTDNPVNSWQAPRDTSVCGTSLQLTLTGFPPGTGFTWDDGQTGTSRLFSGSGIYRVTANYIGCLKKDTIDIGIHPIPTVNLGVDTMYCETAPNVLKANFTGNITGFLWNNGATTATLPISTTGTYWLEATTAFGCKHRDSINITSNPINSWQALSDSSICDRTIYTATMKGYPAGTAFSWYDGLTGNTHIFSTAGTYKVKATYIGCIRDDSVRVHVRPLPVINLGKDTILCSGFTLPLMVSYPGASYTWNTGKTDSSIIADTEGFYWVQSKYNGCTYADTLHLGFVDCDCHVSVPNAFSPNDDGINDIFRVHIECRPANYTFSVYDRYGQTVFHTSNITQGWNGNMNGHRMPVGTYYYIVSYFNSGLGRNELFKGYVVLLK